MSTESLSPEGAALGKKLAMVAIFLGIGAACAMVFVMVEPIAAYDKLGSYDFPPDMHAMLEQGRMNEAAYPTLIGLVAGVAALALGLKGRLAAPKLGMGAMVLGGISAALGVYVMASYPLSF